MRFLREWQAEIECTSLLRGWRELKCYLHRCLVGALNLQKDIPGTKHRKCLVAAKSGDVRGFAAFDDSVCGTHIHQFHVGGYLYLCIRDRIAAAIIDRNNHVIVIVNTRRLDLQINCKVTDLLCLYRLCAR